jgi:cold shock CspA family protein
MILPAQITFRNMDHSDKVESLIREKIASLDKYYKHIMNCRVMVEVPHRHRVEAPNYHVRVDLTVPGGEIVVAREPSLHSGVQDVEGEEACKSMEVEQSHKHLEVAIKGAFDAARRKLQDFARSQRADVKTHVNMAKGRVTRLLPAKGYGYVETEDGREVYFHKKSVLKGDFDHLRVGSEVAFVEEEGDKGPQASTVRLPGRHRSHKASA